MAISVHNLTILGRQKSISEVHFLSQLFELTIVSFRFIFTIDCFYRIKPHITESDVGSIGAFLGLQNVRLRLTVSLWNVAGMEPFLNVDLSDAVGS